VSLFMS